MNKPTFLTTLVLCLAMCSILSLYGATPGVSVNKDHIFVRAGYGLESESNLDGGMVLSIGGTHFFSSQLALELEGQYQLMTSNYSEDQGTDKLGNGDLKLININASACYYMPAGRRSGFHLLAGIGYSFNQFSGSDDYSDLGFDVTGTVDNCLTFHFGAGFDWLLTAKIGLNLEARYSFATANGTWEIRDTLGTATISGDTETKLNRLILMAGFKYYL